jgi:hypothetical protein
MRRIICTAVLCLVGEVAVAGAWGELSGVNQDGERIVIKDDTRSLEPEIIVSTPQAEVSFPFEGACSFSLLDTPGPPREFGCRVGGPSPLAGTRYRRVGAADACRNARFACIEGCASRKVPKTLHYSPWEC